MHVFRDLRGSVKAPRRPKPNLSEPALRSSRGETGRRGMPHYHYQARTQDFAQEGATCSRRDPPVYPGAPWRLGAQKTRGPRMTAGAHWVIRGPSGNQGYMNETLIYIFIPSKRFIHCLEKNIPGPEGAQGGAMPLLGYVTDHYLL